MVFPVAQAILKYFLKPGRLESPLFTLHYRASAFLVILAVILTSKEYFGTTIDCEAEKNLNYVNAY